MSEFIYTALNGENSFIKGRFEARSRKKALLMLEQQGLLLINLNKEKSFDIKKFFNISVISLLDKILLTRQLYVFLEAGIVLDQAIEVAGEQANSRKLKEILNDIYESVISGKSFYASLQPHEKYFSHYFVNLVRVGEESGTLEGTLKLLTEQLEKSYELRTKTRNAFIYPSIIIVAAMAMVTLMLTFVIPTISSVLLEYGGTLPLPTKILIAVSDFFVSYGWTLLPFAALMAYAFKKVLDDEKGRMQVETCLFSMPFIKNIIVEYNIAKFARAMTAPLKSGLSLDRSLLLSAEIFKNVHYKKSILAVAELVRRGIPLSEILKGYPDIYTPDVIKMLEIGEKTGNLDNMFDKLAVYYEKSVINTFNNLSSVIEPFLLVSVGLVVGFITISILTPMWKFADTI